jgi:hypothetical protein
VRAKEVGEEVSALWNPRQQGGQATWLTRAVPNTPVERTAHSAGKVKAFAEALSGPTFGSRVDL